MARKTIVAGNWKMHTDAVSAHGLAADVLRKMTGMQGEVGVILAPPYPFLPDLVQLLSGGTSGDGARPLVAAQNCHTEDQGAFTGEVSAPMLASIGVDACIVGHSERRKYQGETDEMIGRKIANLLKHGLLPIYCCGESRQEREQGRHQAVVGAQLNAALGGLPGADLSRIVVAYEPVWAIGTGLTATPEQAQEMHAFIRSRLQALGGDAASGIPILYGGSCKPSNAEGLFSQADIDGGLIGGAALVADDFIELVRIAGQVKAGK